MIDRKLEADYVVIGAGAVAMAFADTLISESDASIVMVDRRHKPGGHWNDAYPFVRLHSASMYYGVNSRELGGQRIETDGFNRGHLELATGTEICAYFDQIMRHQFLPSGRVTYLPMCEFGEDRVATSRVTGERIRLAARRKFVDATYTGTRLPSTHPPAFSVSTDSTLIPPNSLPQVNGPAAGFVIIGAGKTAMDVGVWLLERGVDPGRITWIRPRDTWVYNRKHLQPSLELFADTIEGITAELEAARDAATIEDLFRNLEGAKALMRIDRTAEPTMFRCATASEHEVALLGKIETVIRLGHVKSIDGYTITLDGGTIPTSSQHIHIDCTAEGVPTRLPQPIFQEDRIVLQPVIHCWLTLSGAFAAHIEATRSGDAEKNALAMPLPMAREPLDWARLRLLEARNEAAWAGHPDIQAWFEQSRLDSFTGLFARIERQGTPEQSALISRYYQAKADGIAGLIRLMAGDGGASTTARQSSTNESRERNGSVQNQSHRAHRP